MTSCDVHGNDDVTGATTADIMSVCVCMCWQFGRYGLFALISALGSRTALSDLFSLSFYRMGNGKLFPINVYLLVNKQIFCRIKISERNNVRVATSEPQTSKIFYFLEI